MVGPQGLSECRCEALGGHAYFVVQEFGREISSVRPHERLEFRMDLKRAKHGWIAKRLEHRAVKFGGQVDLAGGAVAKPQPDDETADVPRFDDVIGHGADDDDAIVCVERQNKSA